MGKFSVYVVDTETTGLSMDCDIIEVSFYKLETGEQKTWHLKAVNESIIEATALEVNHHRLEDITWKTEEGKQKYRLPEEVLPEIENWIAEDSSSALDRVMVGHNVYFDSERLKFLWERNSCAETYPFGRSSMDTKTLAIFLDWIEEKNEGSYALGSIVKRLGITKRKAHTASEDVAMTVDMLNYFRDKYLGQLKEVAEKKRAKKKAENNGNQE